MPSTLTPRAWSNPGGFPLTSSAPSTNLYREGGSADQPEPVAYVSRTCCVRIANLLRTYREPVACVWNLYRVSGPARWRQAKARNKGG